jgi:hypothetical protein
MKPEKQGKGYRNFIYMHRLEAPAFGRPRLRSELY